MDPGNAPKSGVKFARFLKPFLASVLEPGSYYFSISEAKIGFNFRCQNWLLKCDRFAAEMARPGPGVGDGLLGARTVSNENATG